MFLLIPAYTGSPGQKAVKRLCVCVCACACARARARVRVHVCVCVCVCVSWLNENTLVDCNPL